MADNIGICVVGLSQGISHVKALSSLRDEGVKLFVCDIVEEKARTAAMKYGAGAWFSDYKEVLARDDVHALSICLPHHLHCKVMVESAEAGKHVLVEKPMARTLKEADDMIAAAKRADIRLMVAEHHRFMPSVLKAKDLIDKGSLGEIFLIQCSLFSPDRYVGAIQEGWKSENKKRGGGVLLSSAVHRVNVLRTLGGEVASVYCLSPPKSYYIADGEETALLSLSFKNGAVGSLVTSWATRLRTMSPGPWFSIYGTDGSVLSAPWPDYHTLSVVSGKLPECSDSPIELNLKEEDIYQEQIKDFIDSIRTGRESLVSGEEGRKDMEVCIAGYRSIAAKRVITLPL